MSDVQTDASLAARFTSGVGLVDISPSELQSRLSNWQGPWRPWSLESVTNNCREAIEFLSELSHPVTRHVVFAGRRGAALVNNGRDGSDYAGGSVLSKVWQCRFARIVNHRSRVWTNGVQRIRRGYHARIFELWGRKGEHIRSVTCADDGGRWVFETFGDPHPIETNFPYDARKKSSRFSEQNLFDLSAAYGLPVPTSTDFLGAGHYLLYGESHSYPAVSCTIEEADDPAYGYYMRGMGFAKHMKTHASSVIIDLEKCIAINPAYAPRVEPVLVEARRIMARKTRNHVATLVFWTAI